MKGKMPRSSLRRTPKVFGTSYQPPTPSNSRSSVVRQRAWRPIAVVATLVIGAFLIARLPFFQIKSVTAEGVTSTELTADLQALVGHSIFSSQITRVTNRWLSRDQSLESLVCRRGIPNTVRCSATNRTGVMVWRQGGAEFWVDQNGRAFALRAATEPAPLVVEDQGVAVKLGGNVASREIVDVFLRLHQRLAERSIAVKHFFVADVLYQPGAVITSFPVNGQTNLEKELTAVFAVTESIESQVRTLSSLLASRGTQIQTRIDLRVPGYVYYH